MTGVPPGLRVATRCTCSRGCQSRTRWASNPPGGLGFTPDLCSPGLRYHLVGLRSPAVRRTESFGLPPSPGVVGYFHEFTFHGGIHHDQHILNPQPLPSLDCPIPNSKSRQGTSRAPSQHPTSNGQSGNCTRLARELLHGRREDITLALYLDDPSSLRRPRHRGQQAGFKPPAFRRSGSLPGLKPVTQPDA